MRHNSKRRFRCSSMPCRTAPGWLHRAACRRWTCRCATTCARDSDGAPCLRSQPLGETDARAVLRREAERRGIVLSDDVLGFLLTRFSRDLKHLMTLLERLDEFALAEHRAVTVPLLKKLFEEEGATL